MFTFISKLNIKQRIVLSFALILAISTLFTVFNMVSLRSFHQQFMQYQYASADTNLMFRIDHDLAELQKHVLIYSYNHDVTSTVEIESKHKELVLDVNQLIKQHSFKKASDKLLLLEMQTSIESFNDRFGTLKEQRQRRDDYIYNKLANGFKLINTNMTKLSTHVGVEQNNALIKDLWKSQLGIAEAEQVSFSYFNLHQLVAKKEVEFSLALAIENLQEAITLTKDADLKAEIGFIVTSLKRISLVFNEADQADQHYFSLVETVVINESSALNKLSEALKLQAVDEQRQLFLDAENDISVNEDVAIYTSILNILIAIGVALVIVKYISKPLKSITETFNHLALGERVTEIPGGDRHDEIGDLARAANVFNETNVRTLALLRESEEATAALKRREEALEKLNEELDNFTHVASHDLKSPIQGVADLIEWIQDDLGADVTEDVKNNFDRVDIRIKRMMTLVDDLLKYSQAGKTSVDVTLIEPSEMIDEILELLVIPPNIEVTVSGKVAAFETTKTPLQTTIRNLVSNAIKHHDKANGQVNIHMAEEEKYYQFDIQDDGPGIPEADQEKVFLLFNTGSQSGESTGMGLAFCKRMVEAQGGRVEVDLNEGDGCTFRIFWPKNTE